MKSILIIDDEDFSLESYLTSALDEFDFEVDNIEYASLSGNPDVERFSALFVLVNLDNREQIIKFLSGIRSTRVFIFLNDYKDHHLFLEKVSGYLSGLVWDMKAPVECLEMTLRMLDQTIDRYDLDFLNSELGLLQDQFTKELEKTKKLHLEMIPKRYQRYKGLNIFTKYVVGEQGGGEFFDFAQNSAQSLIFLCQAESYMGTSLAMMSFAELKGQQEYDKQLLHDFLKELRAKLISEKLNDKRFTAFVYLYHHGFQKVEGYSFGEYDILGDDIGSFSSNTNDIFAADIENSFFEAQLKLGSKQVILSPGFRANFSTQDEYYEALKKIRKLDQKNPAEKLNEVFLLVPDAGNTKFFKRDITALSIEVESNAIFKI